MRQLIRPTLILVAESGLFFAILLWWFPIAGRHMNLTVGGLEARHYFGYELKLKTKVIPVWVLHEMVWGGEIPSKTTHFDAVGIIVEETEYWYFMRFDDWLIIAGFALFYAVLKWAYRDRKRAARNAAASL